MVDENNNIKSTEKLQAGIPQIQRLTKKLKIKLIESRLVHVDFENERLELIPINNNGIEIP